MTNDEVRKLLKSGQCRFMSKRSKRIYIIHWDQAEILTDNADDVLLIGFPETLSPKMSMRRYRGRKWAWLSPQNIVPAPKTTPTSQP